MTIVLEHVAQARPVALQRDVKKTLEALRVLVSLDTQDPSMDLDTQQSIQQAGDLLKGLRAEDVAAAMIVGGVRGEASLVMWNQARRALYALAPVVVMRLAQKMDDDSSPGNVRILSEVAKGLGLLVPGSGITDQEREKEIAKRTVVDMTDTELDARLRELRSPEES